MDSKSLDGAESKDSDPRCISPEAKTSGPIISLWETGVWKKRKVLSGGEPLAGMKEYISISFSADGRNIAAQGSGPDWILVLWSLEKSKIFATAKASIPQTEVYQVSFPDLEFIFAHHNLLLYNATHSYPWLYEVMNSLLWALDR